MTDKKFNLIYRSTIITPRVGSQATKLFIRVMILGVLIGSLAFNTSERSTISVRADNCSSVWMSLEVCHFGCASLSPFASHVGEALRSNC